MSTTILSFQNRVVIETLHIYEDAPQWSGRD